MVRNPYKGLLFLDSSTQNYILLTSSRFFYQLWDNCEFLSYIYYMEEAEMKITLFVHKEFKSLPVYGLGDAVPKHFRDILY